MFDASLGAFPPWSTRRAAGRSLSEEEEEKGLFACQRRLRFDPALQVMGRRKEGKGPRQVNRVGAAHGEE